MELTAEEKRKIYEELRLEYRTEDAKCHCEDFLSNEYYDESDKELIRHFDETDYQNIAEIFLDNNDCNVAENDRFGAIISDYIEVKREEREGENK